MIRRTLATLSRRVITGDRSRSPMMRLLEDGQLPPDASGNITVAVSYDQQWRTLWKAQRLGYLDANQRLTDKGRAKLERARARAGDAAVSS